MTEPTVNLTGILNAIFHSPDTSIPDAMADVLAYQIGQAEEELQHYKEFMDDPEEAKKWKLALDHLKTAHVAIA